MMKVPAANEYMDFKRNNRIKVNRYLNYVLWFFALAGPAIASGVKGGVFPNITHTTCFIISALVILLSTIHLILRKTIPTSVVTGLFALTAVDALLVYMNISHISIYLTWFLVPMLSLLFCSKTTFLYAIIVNFLMMVAATVLNAPYQMQLLANRTEMYAYLANVLGGFTIETLVMAASGFMILKLTTDYYATLFEQNTVIRDHEHSMKEKMDILDSMAEIYDNVNLISFVENTEMSLRNSNQKKHGIDMRSQTHTLMNQRIQNQVMPDQLESFLEFTNITTVRRRMENKKLISADFIDVVSGWFRAQYITVDAAPDGMPNVVIYTTRNVDEEKRREEHLIRISLTDEMTRLYNRRCYEEDLTEYRAVALSEDFVLFSIDVNGLKTVNDTKGHAAGDELIKGAADCLALSIGSSGKVYRTGGDEFMAIVHSAAPDALQSRIIKKSSEWHGVYTENLTISVGYASHHDHPDAAIDALERIADNAMYSAKAHYYEASGIDRRH